MDFVMLGDWGGQPEPPYYTPAQKYVASQMGKKAAEINSKFTIALGDNFYHFGVKDVDDPRFKATFEVSELYQPRVASIGCGWYKLCTIVERMGQGRKVP